MNPDLDQWLIKPNPVKTVDHLAAFKKMTISSPQPLFRLPSILTSDNAATWLVTRKGANNEEPSDSSSIKSHMTKIGKDDNAKWLLKPETPKKVETDLVVVSDELSPWLARSVMTTSLSTLPGKRSSATSHQALPSHFSDRSSIDKWLWKPLKTPTNKNQLVSKSLDEWLWVPNNETAKYSDNPFCDWKKKSLNQSWIMDNGSMDRSNVQEWLKKALDDDNNEGDSSDSSDDDDDDFEVISQSS